MVRLEEPPYTDECWFTTKACGYKDATILIAVHPDLPVRAPDIVAMLRKWDFNIDVFKEVASWQSDNPDATANDAALWWLNGKSDLWDRMGYLPMPPLRSKPPSAPTRSPTAGRRSSLSPTSGAPLLDGLQRWLNRDSRGSGNHDRAGAGMVGISMPR